MERFDTVTVGFITPSVQIAFDVFELVFCHCLYNCEAFLVCYSSFLNAFPYSIPPAEASFY